MDLKLDLKSLDLKNRQKIERRKPNWTECENVFLLDQFSLHRDILTCKATDASTNLRKQEIWRLICQNLNNQNVLVRRTPAEVRRKWKNLVTAAKKELWEIRHSIQVTGLNKKISELSSRVLQLHAGYFQSCDDNTDLFAPIITISEENMSLSSEEGSGIVDLRIKKDPNNNEGQRCNNGNSIGPSDKDLARKKLELQVQILKLRKLKLRRDLKKTRRFFYWRTK